jgi:uncharacterized SAM-binding protein YcdF (DUF218 family)
MRLPRYLLIGLGLVVAIPAVLFLKLCLDIEHQGRLDLAQPADVIVVLGAKLLPDGKPSPDLEERTRHGVELYQAGWAPNLICTGGPASSYSSGAAVAKELAISWGVPEGRVFLAEDCRITSDDARRTAAVMAEHGWQRAILVSHPLHVYRAKLLFEREGIIVYTSPTTTDVDGIALPWRVYYTVREGLFTLEQLMR